MGTRLNHYYNNPAIGQAISNLASIFEPPSPGDVLAYAQAEKTRKEMGGLDSLYGLAGDPNADPAALDRWGAVTGQWNPNQGFGARDMADATNRYGVDVGASTARRGQDITAETTRRGQDVTARSGLVEGLFGPLNQGQVRPELPTEVMDIFGLPGLGAEAGLPPDLSETEVEGQLLLDAIGEGLVTPQDSADAYLSSIPLEQVIEQGAETPSLVRRGNAEGLQPFVNPGTPPAPKVSTYRTPDGKVGTAVIDPTTRQMTDITSGEVLPQGTILGEIQDTAEGLTGGTHSRAQRAVMDIDLALDTVGRLQTLIAQSPASGGLVGTLRGTLQDVIATGGELGQLAQELGAQAQEDLAGMDPEAAAFVQQAFDPAIPARQALTILAATQIAKAQSPDRVSNELLNRITRSLGEGGFLANQQRTDAALSAIIQDLQSRRDVAAGFAGGGLPPGPGVAPAMPADPGAPALPQTRPRAVNAAGEMIEWDGQAWTPVR